ncbi:MAG: tRNA 2-thiouridine(34) synthase MnmA [Proteobacteria bacterium]|nr:MAG: tRNA 2-thiouridine(34) synthase MnmA [Pseudomonadota bacterium]
MPNKVVVAMSGGVDSSVAALLVHKQGYDAIGVSMQVWDYRKNGGCESRATCCSPDDFTDARKVASDIGIKYYVFDFEKSFGEKVIEKFVATYQRGETPNPCVDCNNEVKFKELRARANSMGVGSVATGHYAQIRKSAAGYHLLRGRDQVKDQSYFLYGLRQHELGETIFPVGHLEKSEVREMAKAHGLKTAEKPESQDICFVSGRVEDFLVRLGSKKCKGEIIDRRGRKVGEHEGIHAFTVGQRKGLRIGGPGEALYVLELDAARNRVIVGRREELERGYFEVSELSFCSPVLLKEITINPKLTFECLVQVRHRHSGVRAVVKLFGDGRAKVSFISDWAVASPGQAAVFYSLDNQEVLGGGRITALKNVELRPDNVMSVYGEARASYI